MDNEIRDGWEAFLNPEKLKCNMIVASLFITGFEILKQSIIEHIYYFFSYGFDKNGPKIDEKYRIDVLNRNNSKLYASLSWLKE